MLAAPLAAGHHERQATKAAASGAISVETVSLESARSACLQLHGLDCADRAGARGELLSCPTRAPGPETRTARRQVLPVHAAASPVAAARRPRTPARSRTSTYPMSWTIWTSVCSLALRCVASPRRAADRLRAVNDRSSFAPPGEPCMQMHCRQRRHRPRAGCRRKTPGPRETSTAYNNLWQGSSPFFIAVALAKWRIGEPFSLGPAVDGASAQQQLIQQLG